MMFLHFFLGTINTKFKNDPKDCAERDDRETLNLPEKETEGQGPGLPVASTEAEAITLAPSVEDKEQDVGFQGR